MFSTEYCLLNFEENGYKKKWWKRWNNYEFM